MLLISGSFLIITFAAIIHFIKETYTKLIERNRAEQQKTETELKLQEAKLKLLQGQLHPHFLFNMLNNLYGLWIENSKSTPDVILKLSSLLDYMLYECNKDKVPLKDEVQFINNYIELERLRHDDRLKVELQISEILDNHMIAPLILFCFVENAFKHGANKTSGESNIYIHLKFKNDLLEFDVQNSFVQSNMPKTSSGVGLKNVQERLNLLYPNEHNLQLVENNGVYRATLSLKLN
jgi:LytS/YehU family sensor histidine kinase